MQRFHAHSHIAKELDKLIDLILASTANPGVRIQVEATVIHKTSLLCQVDLPDRVILDTIDVGPLQHEPHYAGCCHVDESSPQQERRQLPSPTTSDTQSPREAQSPPEQGLYGVDQRRSSEVPAEENARVQTRLSTRRRKTVGGLSIPRLSTIPSSQDEGSQSLPTTRQLQTGHDHFRKRRRLETGPKLEESTVNKLIEGIWKELHNPNSLVLDQRFPELLQTLRQPDKGKTGAPPDPTDFDLTTHTCRQITEGSRTGRALEVIMQAHWVDSFDAQLASLAESGTDLRPSEQKRATLVKACELFNWSEKELRNRM